jgi:hypothetical protein
MRDVDFVAVIEQRERVLESALSQVAPRADDVGPDMHVHQKVETSADKIARQDGHTMMRPARGNSEVKLTCVRFSGMTRRLRMSSWQCGHRADRSSV